MLNKIILCIGTSKCIGDSLGPLVGEELCSKINKSNVLVLGNIKNNVTYQNIDIILNKINKKIKNPYFVVVDSALSNKEYIGEIIVSKEKMTIGNALNKCDYSFGNLGIKGIVGENQYNEIKNFNELNNVPHDLIKKLSINISNKIINVLNV